MTTPALPPCRYLSIRQPYATAVVRGLKMVENRSWGTTYRGLVLIHAGVSRRHAAPRRPRAA